MNKVLRLLVACCATFLTTAAFADNLPPKLLSSFEPGTPVLTGQGVIVKEHASDGAHSYKVTASKGQYAGVDIVDGQPLKAFKDYILFKVDVFNPTDKVVRLSARIDDASSKDYGSRYNDDSLVAPPGNSTVSINLTGVTRSNARNFASRQGMDLATLRQVSVFFTPKDDQPVTLYFDNIRLEGSGLPDVAGLRAFDFGPPRSPVYAGFTGCDAETTFSDERGFGWINPSTSDNVYMPDELTGDYASGDEFRAKLPNGKYEVHMCIDHFGLWATYPFFKQRTLTINGKEVLNEKWTGKEFLEQRYFAHENDEDLPGQDWWDKYIAPRNIIRRYSVEVTDGYLHVKLASDSRFGSGISFLVVYPETKKAEGDKWMETLQAKRKAQFNRTLIVRLPDAPAASAKPLDLTKHKAQRSRFVPFVRSSEQDLSVNAVPLESDGSMITLQATPGERAHGIIGLYPLQECKNVKFNVLGHTTDAGAHLPPDWIQVRHIRNFLKRSGMSRLGTIEPRVLTESKPLDLIPGVTRGVFVTVRVPDDARPGIYDGEVRFTGDGYEASTYIRVTVLPFKLDKITDMTMSVTGATAGHWRGWFPNTDDAWWKNAEVAMKNMADHGMNAVTGGPGAKLIAVKNGKPEIDYTDMDRWLALAVKHGLTMPGDAYQGLTIAGLPWNQGPDMLAVMEADSQKRFGLPYKDLVRIVFADVEQHAREKAWPTRIYSYVDEPRPEYRNVEPVAQWIKIVTEAAPNTMFAGYYSSGEGRDVYFDTFPVSIAHVEKTAVERTQKSGKQLWEYAGGGSRHDIGRWAFVAHQAGLKGFLRNGYMYVCSDPYFDFSDDEGSWNVVYPSKNGINDTVGWERTSDGVNDYRYLATLSRLIADARAKNAAKAQADAADAYLKETLKPIDVYDRKTADLTPEQFAGFRRNLAEHITALTQALAK